MDFKNEISKLICNVLNKSQEEVEPLLVEASKQNMGDFAFPCFKFAKELRKSPQAIAEQLATSISQNNFVDKVEAVSGYANFFVNKAVYVQAVFTKFLEQKENYGTSNIGNGRAVTIDYSSPNIAKPFHIGHFRTTVIGNALYKIHKALGYNAIGINHLGDWGTQFGKTIDAYRRWGDKQSVIDGGVNELVNLYVRFHKEAETNTELNDIARATFLKLQEGDEDTTALWKWFCDISIKEFDKQYERLGIKFDYYTGESFYADKTNAVVDELRQKGLLVESEGAQVVMLDDYKMPPYLIVRSDGGTVYSTRDIAAAIYRKNTFNFEKSLYVTGFPQSLHFSQLFKVVELMGYDWAKDMYHVAFGHVALESGKLSTREGNSILLEELLDTAVEKAAEIIEQKNPNLKDKQDVAAAVGIGALVFNDLYNNRIKDVIFSWDKVLNFDGETGPYAQYTFARASNVIRKAPAFSVHSEIDYKCIEQETALCRLIEAFPKKVEEAAERLEPYIISRHIIDVAQAFNKFYHDNQIICDDEKLMNARLLLTYAVSIVISQGLSFLGISAPSEM